MNMSKEAIRHIMEMGAAVNGGNPYHALHIHQFCNYADAAAEEVMEELPQAVQKEVGKQLSGNKVQVEIDKQSMKKAQKAIDELLSPLKKWFK